MEQDLRASPSGSSLASTTFKRSLLQSVTLLASAQRHWGGTQYDKIGLSGPIRLAHVHGSWRITMSSIASQIWSLQGLGVIFAVIYCLRLFLLCRTGGFCEIHQQQCTLSDQATSGKDQTAGGLNLNPDAQVVPDLFICGFVCKLFSQDGIAECGGMLCAKTAWLTYNLCALSGIERPVQA